MTPAPNIDWEERYRHAAALGVVQTLPKIENAAIEGYWVDDESFFFLKQKYDADLRLSVDTPWLFSAVSGRAFPLLDLGVLSQALARVEGDEREPAVIAQAGYAMRAPGRVIARFPDKWFEIDWAAGEVTAHGTLDASPKVLSGDGQQACVLDGYNLVLRDLNTGETRPLTHDGVACLAYGRLPENNLSPIAYARWPSPIALWSADGKWLLTHLVDERDAPDTALVQHAPPGGGRPEVHRFKLSTVDDPVPLAALVAIEVTTGRRVQTGFHALQLMSPLMCGAAWFSGDGSSVFYIASDRYRRQVRLMQLDLASGEERAVIEETALQGYVETHPIMFHAPNVRVLERAGEVIWYSDRDGWGHLYLAALEGGQIRRQITTGDWMVRDIVHVDEEARTVTFTASGLARGVDAGRRQLCEISIDGGELRVLASHDGDVAVAASPLRPDQQSQHFRPDLLYRGASPGGRHVVLRRTHVRSGATTSVMDRSSGEEVVLCTASTAVGLQVSPPVELTLLAADDSTPIHGVLVLPREAVQPHGAKTIPLIDLMYPGPQAPWTPRGFGLTQVLAAQSLAELGFAVALLDSRGLPHRSRAIRQAGYGSLLEPQLADHAAAIQQICSAYPQLDPERVGAMGVSAGGAGAARAILDYPSTYACAVAIAGSHDPRTYRGGWADFYLGPQSTDPSNPDLAHKLQGALMLVSGDFDDNVPVSQTMRLADALIRANKDFELLIAPNEGHLTFLMNGYVHRRVLDFLVRELFGARPPREFPLHITPSDLSAYGRALSRGAVE